MLILFNFIMFCVILGIILLVDLFLLFVNLEFCKWMFVRVVVIKLIGLYE